MRLDPVLAAYLADQPDLVWNDALDLAAVRAAENAESRAAPRLADLHEVRDTLVPGPPGAPEVAVRIYRPSPNPGLPVTLYLHGGGFVVGSLDTHDNAVRLLAEQARTVVVAVDYRLAPEHPYPAAVEDALAAYRWTLAHAADLGGDPDRVAVAGDSAGGLLAAVLCFAAPERGLRPPMFQLLVYPSTGAGPTESARAFADASGLRPDELAWYQRAFLGAAPPESLPAYLSPARAPDLSGLPPAYVLTAEADPLRDDGALYARRLAEAGVAAHWHDSPGMVHGFLRFLHAVPAARAAAQPAFDALRAALHG
ncbi:alpha/beta hydrolase [Streptomonospora sp. S1-112]|uniref:Alpha/beta hydrolase n=1 Tax=Streptomonospora mangrovi TaxID=2883123 RepID=A0A9X3NLM0_9ACTN|nr:alpha/beta hydrolase [Streptomonospora mangrovi]MDA0562745.1 alpha/beta hydrolase [Streptomonospora mangrovi]